MFGVKQAILGLGFRWEMNDTADFCFAFVLMHMRSLTRGQLVNHRLLLVHECKFTRLRKNRRAQTIFTRGNGSTPKVHYEIRRDDAAIVWSRRAGRVPCF